MHKREGERGGGGVGGTQTKQNMTDIYTHCSVKQYKTSKMQTHRMITPHKKHTIFDRSHMTSTWNSKTARKGRLNLQECLR